MYYKTGDMSTEIKRREIEKCLNRDFSEYESEYDSSALTDIVDKYNCWHGNFDDYNAVCEIFAEFHNGANIILKPLNTTIQMIVDSMIFHIGFTPDSYQEKIMWEFLNYFKNELGIVNENKPDEIDTGLLKEKYYITKNHAVFSIEVLNKANFKKIKGE